MSSSPIADLSYRNYDGPLEKPYFRWWAIAKMMMRLCIKKKGFWVWSVFSAYFYLILGAVFYFAETFSSNIGAMASPDAIPQFFQGIVWKDQFLIAFNMSQIWLLIVTLLIGAGSIAGDNRANALLVYLSKPCTKLDYLIGKWVGIFLPLLAVTGLPMLLFYFYCFLSYRQYGFVSQDPWLIMKLLMIIPLPAAFHASVVLGISSLTNQGRVSGAIYAGLYFMTSFLTVAAGGIRAMTFSQEGEKPLLTNLYYASVDGIQQGLAKIILDTRGSAPFNAPTGISQPPPPNKLLFVGIYFAICAICLFVAWRRIRAVEVVGS